MSAAARSTVIANAIRVERSVVACSLAARFLARRFECEVVDSAHAVLRRSRYHTLIMINSPWGFCDEAHRARVRQLLWGARRIVWVQQDYNSGIGPRSFKSMGAWLDGGGAPKGCEEERPPGRDGVRRLELWTSIPAYVERGHITPHIPLDPKRSRYVNWNALHYEGALRRDWDAYPLGSGVYYFGAYRPDRGERFARYLSSAAYPVTISTALGKSAERFRAVAPRATIEPRAENLIARLGTVTATVVIQDVRNDGLYQPPAARFYEALSAGTCQLIDEACVPNFTRAGLAVDDRWVVTCARDVARLLPRAPELAQAQREAWATARIRKEITKQLEGIL